MEKNRLPLGVEFFDKLRREQYYYIDKTGLISELEKRMGKVNLFTRPNAFMSWEQTRAYLTASRLHRISLCASNAWGAFP